MKTKHLAAIFVAALSAINAGCATNAPIANATLNAADVKIYHGPQLPPRGYETVKRLWVDSWRAAFSIPTWPSVEQGIEGLKSEAAQVGANALIDVACYADDDRRFAPFFRVSKSPAYTCYGTAIRVR